MHLSFLSPLIALVLSLYSIATTILHIVLTPFSLCARRKPLSQQLIRTLSPVIRVQLRMIYSDKTEALTQIRAGRLALVAILSPFYAFWIAMSAWVAGFFWLYAAILGEPNVGEGKEMEGKAAVRGVRKWWENWLLFGIK